MTRPESRAGARPRGPSTDREALLVCALYAIVMFACYCVWNHFMAELSVDEAYFENILWNASHGYGLRTDVEGPTGLGLPHLALHFTPALWLLVPLYFVFPSMHVVHAVVSLGVATAGFAFYRFARTRLDRDVALLLMGAFLLNPTMMLQTFMETHDQALAFLPLMLLLIAYTRAAIVPSLVAGLVFVAIREENALLVLALAALAFVVRRNARLGAALLALGAGWLALYRWYGVGVLAQGHESHLFSGTYGVWGKTPAEVARAVITHPVAVARHILSPVPIAYLAQLLAPFYGILGFGSTIVLAMLPALFMVLLAKHETRMFVIRMHYSIVPVTLLYVGSIGTLGALAARTLAIGGRRVRVTLVLAVMMLAASFATVPVWVARAVGRLNPDVPEIRAVMRLVPDTASVTAPNYMLNHMARRRHIAKTWDGPLTTTEYVILEEPFVAGAREVRALYSPADRDTLRRAGYVPVLERNGWHVWRRGPSAPTEPAGMTPANGPSEP